MLSGVAPELLAFCGAWLERDPRLLLACQFAAAGDQRERFLATAVLQRELAQAAIAVSDRRVAEAKLAWWIDEAGAWALGHPRHPLAYGLDARASAHALARLVALHADWLQAPSPHFTFDQQCQVVAVGQGQFRAEDRLNGLRLIRPHKTHRSVDGIMIG